MSNTGQGDFQLLNRYLQGQDDLVPKGKGFGIRNINRRIRLLYGEQFGLSYCAWHIQPGGGGQADLPLNCPCQGDEAVGISAELTLPL